MDANITVEFEVNVKGDDGKLVKVADLAFVTPKSLMACIEQIKAGEHDTWESVADFYGDAIAAAKVRLASKAKSRYLAEQRGEGRKAGKSARDQLRD